MSGAFEAVIRRALAALDAGETLALCTVVQSKGSTPRHTGARMLVWPDGRIEGTIGGAALEQRVIEQAVEAIRAGRARLERYVFSTNPADQDSVGLCGGANDVLIEVLKPRPHLLILGAGHIGRELAQIAARLEMQVSMVDDRPDFLAPNDFPPGVALFQVAYQPETETLAPLPATLAPNTYAVLATWGWDGPALAQLLDSPAAYVGLVASRTKARTLLERFAGHAPPERIAACFRSPVGLDIGAETPAEIALAILAEILAVHNQREGAMLSPAQRTVETAADL